LPLKRIKNKARSCVSKLINEAYYTALAAITLLNAIPTDNRAIE